MKIGIIGTGRLGICVALTLSDEGYEVIGVDKNATLIQSLVDGSYASNEPEVEERLRRGKTISFTTEIKHVFSDEVELLLVYVATPSLSDGSFDHSSIDEVIDELIALGKRHKKITFVIGSTIMPGYTKTVVDRLESLNYSVLYNPEFIAQGSIIRDLIHPDQVLIGEDSSESGDRLVSLYKRFIKSDPAYCRMDPLSAEITKLATNCFLTTKISFANAIGDMTKNLGGNPEAVLSAIGKDSRIGSKYLNYGFGFGGPCFPRDNQAMISAAKSINMPLYLAEATVRVNEEHLNFQLNEQLQENRSIYIFDYVSYKPGTDILVEAQQLKLATELVRQGKKVLIRNSELVRSQLEEMYPGYFEFE
jgi:nucleotide sugar dehydrogenase